MHREAHTDDRYPRTRIDPAAPSRTGPALGSDATSRPCGRDGRPSALQGEFAPPSAPELPAVAAFTDLDIPAPLLAALAAKGVTMPFPIQAATLPHGLAGRDVVGLGKAGSGKTLAYGLALLARTTGRRAEPRQPLALILVPNDVLARQVGRALTPYARALKLRLAAVAGNLPTGRQEGALRGGAEVVVATPGLLLDLVEHGDCRLNQVGITVLDEADQMAGMGLVPQVTAVLDQVRTGGQRMVFSANQDRSVDLLVRCYLTDPVVHSAGAAATMEHDVSHVRATGTPPRPESRPLKAA